MGLLLFIVGAIFALILIVNNYARTLLRRRKLALFEIGLAFFATLLPIAALIVDNQDSARFDAVERLTLGLVVVMLVAHLPLIILELFRRQRLRGSRGIFGVGMAVLLFIAAFSFNLIALNLTLPSDASRRPTPVNALSSVDPCQEAFISLGNTLVQFVATATNLTPEQLLATFVGEGQVSAADLVVATGGDPRDLVRNIVDFGGPALEGLIRQGCVPAAQGAFLISQLETFVSFAINNDINTLTGFLGGNQNQDISAEDAQATRVALVAGDPNAPTSTPLPSLTPSPTITVTPSPTPSRTPFPTDTPTPTRERFQTPTPPPTATLSNPCRGEAAFNVNLRSLPDVTGQLLLTIPFQASFDVYAPNEARTWWYGEYDGQAGWVNAEFITLAPVCADLPPRQP